MNSKYLTLLKNTFVFAVGSLGSKLILFFLVPLYTNCLTADEYGVAELIFTLGQLLVPSFTLAINEAILRFGLMKGTKRENVLLNSVIVFLFSIVFALLATPLFRFYSDVNEWRWYLCIFVISSASTTVFTTYLKVKDQNKLFAVVSILQTAVLAGLNICLLAYLHMGVKGYLIANIIANLITFVVSILGSRVFTELSNSKFDKDLFVKMIAYSSPLIVNCISWWIIHSSDKIMIEFMINTSALGLYTVSSKIPSLINVIIAIFIQAWGISSIKEIESTNDSKFYSKVFKLYSFLTFGAAFILIAIIKPFMHIYVGEEFKSAWVFVPLLLVSAVFSSISAYYGALFAALKKSLSNMKSTLIAAIINIVVNYFGIKLFGIWGAVFGTVAAYIIIAFIRMIGVHKHLKIEVDYFRFFFNIAILITMAVLVSLDFHIAIVGSLGIILFFVVNSKLVVELIEFTKDLLLKKVQTSKSESTNSEH